MNFNVVQLALRETRAVYADRRALIGMGLVGLTLGVVGPFQTFELLNDGLRIVYWLLIVYCTYGAGMMGALIALKVTRRDGAPFWQRLPVMGLGASVPVTLVVVFWNWVFFPQSPFDGWGVLMLWAYCLVVTIAVIGITEGLLAPLMGQERSVKGTAQAPILERVPRDIRAPLVRLATADHYVEVFTVKGKTLILMRMGDAVRETKGVDGLQVHRGHWVAADAVERFTRREGKPVLILTDGTEVPVSRSYIEAVRKRFG